MNNKKKNTKGSAEQHCIDIARKKITKENCYFSSSEEYDTFVDFLNKAESNPNPTKFPDFIFLDGFIEHFQVTSSKEKRKGSFLAREQAELENKTIDKMFKCNNDDTYIDGFSYNDHSRENLIDSFKKNWEKHICNLNKNTEFISKTGIFMVAYFDMALEMAVKLGESSKLEEKHKYLFSDHKYKLSKDKELLKFVSSNASESTIKYVIFVTCDLVEVIEVTNINTILEDIPFDFLICPNHFTTEFKVIQDFPNFIVPEGGVNLE